jgi:hypothetical protein
MKEYSKKFLAVAVLAFVVAGLSISQTAQAAPGGVHGKPATVGQGNGNKNKGNNAHTKSNKGNGKIKTHNRSIPGKVASVVSASSFTMYKGNKTYTVTNSNVAVKVGDKVIVKGAVTGVDVVAVSVRDLTSAKQLKVTTTTAGN